MTGTQGISGGSGFRYTFVVPGGKTESESRNVARQGDVVDSGERCSLLLSLFFSELGSNIISWA